MRTLLQIIFLILITKTGLSCCAEDNSTLTEKLFKGQPETIFTCTILSTDKNENGDVFSIVEITELFFGSVDSSIVKINTGNRNSSTGGSSLAIGEEYIIYTFGSGSSFGCCGICDRWTKRKSNSKSVLKEIETLSEFSKILKQKESGFFEFYYFDGTIAASGKYKKGVPVGVWRHYYKNGIPKSDFDFKNGINKTYKKNGFIESKSIVENKNSIYEKYSSEDEGLIVYKFITTKNDTGSVMQTFEYYKNGSLKKISGQINVNVKGGSTSAGKTGMFEEYYETGKQKLKGQFEKNRRVGIWRWYYENGDYNTEYDYKDGTGSQ